MKRRFNVIGIAMTFIALAGSLCLISIAMGQKVTSYTVAENVIFLLFGAIISGFICTFLHELGHLIFAKKNGFIITTFKFWFFKWTLGNDGYEFSFILPLSEAGATETVPNSTENVENRLSKVSLGGLIFSFVSMLLGIPALFLYTKLPFIVFCLWVTFLPVGAYFFVGNAFPSSSEGVFNDGGIIYVLNKKTPEGAVISGILKIQAELFAGKTPSEIDESFYFNLPQLQEDSPYFINLLTLRYLFYLDKGDYTGAKAVSDRLLSLDSYMSKPIKQLVYSYALYNACTFDYNEDNADDYTAEIEKYLNKSDDLSVLRIKTAYILYVRKENDVAERFIEKGLIDAPRCYIKGIGRMEERLFNKMKTDL